MKNLEYWKQAAIYLAIYTGIGSYINLLTGFVRSPILTSSVGGYNINFNPITGGIILLLNIISIVAGVYIASKIVNKYLPVSNVRLVSLISAILYLLFAILPTVQMLVFAGNNRDLLLPAMNLSMIPALILPYVLFYFLSVYFLKAKK